MAPIDKFSGTTFTGITTLSGNILASISEVDDIASPSLIQSGDVLNTIFFYSFKDEIVETNASSQWNPAAASPSPPAAPGSAETLLAFYNQNVNLAVPPNWGHPDAPDAETIGWHCDENSTTSSNTGPGTGGVSEVQDNNSGLQLNGSKYIYTETSSPNLSGKVFVCGLLLRNIESLMSDTSNALFLDFMHHAHGSSMGNLYIYGQTESAGTFSNLVSTADHGSATLITEFTNLNSNFSGVNDNFINLAINIDVLKNNELTGTNQEFHMIYFVYQENTTYFGDLAIDNVRITERVP